jgi:hypothetical protein
MCWWWYFHRRYPFVLKGYRLYFCFFCGGFGDDPRGGYECPICYGQGFDDL